jgi:hypothetical protein
MRRPFARSSMLALLALLLFVWLALAQGDYDVSWWQVDGGGGRGSGGPYTIVGTIGQPEAGMLTGGGYTLGGGFWGGGAVARGFRVYLPLTLRGY